MYKYLLFVFICVFITACDHNDRETIRITGSGSTSIVDEPDKYDLEVSGFNNEISVADNNEIDVLQITGSNNQITIGNHTSIDHLNVSGNDNTIKVPVGSGISMNNEGYGNKISE